MTMQTTNPQPLQDQFSEKGYNYKLVKRNEKAAIYSQTWGADGSTVYEVVIPSISNRRRDAEGWKECPPYEVYPSSQQWGDKAWTLLTYEKAVEKLDQIATSFSRGKRRNRFHGLNGSE